MGNITELRIRSIRCFEALQSVKTPRITLLVGENNTGKSTVLGCYKALAEIANLADSGEPNYFGRAPFYPGKFENIARLGTSQFTIGGSFKGHCHSGITVNFTSDTDRNPVDQEVQIEFIKAGDQNQVFDMELVKESGALRITGPDCCFDLDYRDISHESILKWLSRDVSHGHIPCDGQLDEFLKRMGLKGAVEKPSDIATFLTFIRSYLPLPRQRSFFVEALDPLTQRVRSCADLPDNFSSLPREYSDYLSESGRKLKLWTGISIHSNPDHGRQQVFVETPSGWRDLADMGYGVHSALRLLSALCRQRQPTTFLLQQPELHLHPSTQSNLAQVINESKHKFLIETHSDHIIDRFRICVMEGELEPDEVSIAFCALSADSKSSHIHNLGMDKDGNLSNVPSGYRSFFMEETKRLLGFQ